MGVAEQVQGGVHERRTPFLADDLRAHDDVAELPRQPVRQIVELVDRERERVGRLVDAEVLALEVTDLLRTDELKAELAVADSLRLQDLADQV